MNAADDSVELHVQDTLKAGGGLCDPEAVRATVTQAKSAVEWLVQQGVQFRRIVKIIITSLKKAAIVGDGSCMLLIKLALLLSRHSPDLLIENNICRGAQVYDGEQQRSLQFHTTHTVLATGGASFAYLHTSNPNCTSGDGIAMAWRAGCRVANLEFNQFHPIYLYHPLANHYLITEVVRGECGYFLLPNGKRFMPNYADQAEMVPRDIVARAIDTELKKNNWDHVYLDISHRPADFIKKAFPTIYATCLNFGFDMTEEPLPVVPAAHYTCGGVMTDLQAKTDISRLYAIGEVAYTGLHRANRMASNSLLECLVFAASCARAIKSSATPIPRLAEEAAHPFFSSGPCGQAARGQQNCG